MVSINLIFMLLSSSEGWDDWETCTNGFNRKQRSKTEILN